tara:strand:+ start:3733 stop:6723 length:2991 start_codon:yes stop_codon:yes gene_type:complete
MATITHFISPQVIDVDDVNSKVESIIDFVPIPVHAVYHTDTKLGIKCVNITPQLNEATYQIQDLDGNVLDTSGLQAIFEDILPKMHHAEVSGNQVVEESLIGAKLSLINDSLTQVMRDSTVENGLSFNIKNEIFKSISSYMTNHITVSLARTIVDVDENQNTNLQLNTPTFIANELKRYETVTLDVSGDDTKPYLNTFMDLNNSNEVFGDSTVQKLIFIVASDVSVTNDVSSATGLSADFVSAIDTISERNVFSDELGDPLVQQDQTQLNGKWFAALCFDIGTPEPSSQAVIEDGFIKNATVRVRDAVTLETKAVLLSNDSGEVDVPKTFGLVILDVIESESGIQAVDISTDEPFTGTLSAISDSSSSGSIAITPLTSLVSASVISDIEVNIENGTPKTLNEVTSLKSTKLNQVATAFGVSSGDLEVSPINSNNTATAKIAMQISIIEKMVSAVSSESGVDKKDSSKNFMKSLMAQIESKSGGTLDLTDSTELEAVVDSTSTRSGITIESTKLSSLKSGVKNFSDAVSNITTEGVGGLEELAKINKVATEASNAGGGQLDTILNKNVSEIESDASTATIGTVQIVPPGFDWLGTFQNKTFVSPFSASTSIVSGYNSQSDKLLIHPSKRLVVDSQSNLICIASYTNSFGQQIAGHINQHAGATRSVAPANLYKIDLDGNILWTFDDPEVSSYTYQDVTYKWLTEQYSEINVTVFDDDVFLSVSAFNSNSGTPFSSAVYRLNKQTGAIVWRYTFTDRYLFSHVQSDTGMLYVATIAYSNLSQIIKIDKDGVLQTTLTNNNSPSYNNYMQVYSANGVDEILFANSARSYAFDPDTFALKYTLKNESGGLASGWVRSIQDGFIYNTGEGAILKHNITDGTLVWRSPNLSLGVTQNLSLDDNYIYTFVGNNCEIYSKTDGSLLKQFPADNAAFRFMYLDGDGKFYGHYGVYELSSTDISTMTATRLYDLGTSVTRVALTPSGEFFTTSLHSNYLNTYRKPE